MLNNCGVHLKQIQSCMLAIFLIKIFKKKKRMEVGRISGSMFYLRSVEVGVMPCCFHRLLGKIKDNHDQIIVKDIWQNMADLS